MEPRLLDTLPNHLPVLSSAFLLFLAYLLFPRLLSNSKNSASNIPLIGAELGNEQQRKDYFTNHARQLYSQGYAKFKDTIGFRVTTFDSTKLVISPKFLGELRKLPDHVLSFESAIKVQMEQRFTKIPSIGSMVFTPHVVKAELTPALTRINPILSQEVNESVINEIGPCPDWTPININKKLLRIVAMASGRVFLGDLCRDETYIDAAIHYTIELMNAQRALKHWNPLLRPFIGYLLPEVRALKRREADFHRFIRPIIEARKAAMAAGDPLPDDMLQWMMTRAAKAGSDPAFSAFMSRTSKLAEIQLGLTFAAIHTTTMSATNTFYTLAAHPETLGPLRAELRAVLAEHDGTLSFTALQKLRLLDSAMREAQRLHPGGFASFMRRVMTPFTLSDGTTIPAGTLLEVPAGAIAHDPELYPDPDVFKPWRFAERREASDAASARNQFVSITDELLTFGYGRHACPGRFFAANEIKMIVARTLLEYEIGLVESAKGVRYRNLEFGLASIPDPERELMMRSVRD